METEGDLPPDPRGEPPGISTLVSRLVHDGQDYARAEANLFKARAGERAGYALPGIAMLASAAILALALIVALIVTAMVWLAAELGPALAMLVVAIVVSGVIALLGWLGTERLKGALKPREQR